MFDIANLNYEIAPTNLIDLPKSKYYTHIHTSDL